MVPVLETEVKSRITRIMMHLKYFYSYFPDIAKYMLYVDSLWEGRRLVRNYLREEK